MVNWKNLPNDIYPFSLAPVQSKMSHTMINECHILMSDCCLLYYSTMLQLNRLLLELNKCLTIFQYDFTTSANASRLS